MSFLQGGCPPPIHMLLVSFFITTITCFLCFNMLALTCLHSFKADPRTGAQAPQGWGPCRLVRETAPRLETVPGTSGALPGLKPETVGLCAHLLLSTSLAALLATLRECPLLVDPPEGTQHSCLSRSMRTVQGPWLSGGRCGPTSTPPFSPAPPRSPSFASGVVFAHPADSILEDKGASILPFR